MSVLDAVLRDLPLPHEQPLEQDELDHIEDEEIGAMLMKSMSDYELPQEEVEQDTAAPLENEAPAGSVVRSPECVDDSAESCDSADSKAVDIANKDQSQLQQPKEQQNQQQPLQAQQALKYDVCYVMLTTGRFPHLPAHPSAPHHSTPPTHLPTHCDHVPQGCL